MLSWGSTRTAWAISNPYRPRPISRTKFPWDRTQTDAKIHRCACTQRYFPWNSRATPMPSPEIQARGQLQEIGHRVIRNLRGRRKGRGPLRHVLRRKRPGPTSTHQSRKPANTRSNRVLCYSWEPPHKYSQQNTPANCSGIVREPEGMLIRGSVHRWVSTVTPPRLLRFLLYASEKCQSQSLMALGNAPQRHRCAASQGQCLEAERPGPCLPSIQRTGG